MFEDLHIRTTRHEGEAYVHALDMAQHLIFAAAQFEESSKLIPGGKYADLDFAAAETMRMVAKWLLMGDEVSDLEDIETPDEFFATFLDNDDDL
jgi:hypothetical protein